MKQKFSLILTLHCSNAKPLTEAKVRQYLRQALIPFDSITNGNTVIGDVIEFPPDKEKSDGSA